MPQVSKQIIKELIETLDAYGVGAHHPDLLSLLDQPEQEPVAYRYSFTCGKVWTLSHLEPGKAIRKEALVENLYTLPQPLQPITADMVTDEMQEQFLKTPYDAARKDVFVAAVNAYTGAKI
jgi:hypothetical protein